MFHWPTNARSWDAIGFVKDLLTIGPGYQPWFVEGDIPGFFLIFFNNLLGLSLTYQLFVFAAQFSPDFVASNVLPGAGLSIFLGSMFYARQARVLSKQENRTDVCAQPFGLATPSMFGFVTFILLPGLKSLPTATAAYGLTLFSNFWSGWMEAGTALYGHWVHEYVPVAALFSALGGIGIALITTGPLYQICEFPIVGMIPFLLFLFFMASQEEIRVRLTRHLSFGIPNILVVVSAGIALAWITNLVLPGYISFASSDGAGFTYPHPSFSLLWSAFQQGSRYLAIFLPLALINGVGSLQCITTAHKVGDNFNTPTSLAANGLCTVISSLFGNPFPTSIFIGHPTAKKLGARSGYMLLNGVACLLVTSFGLINVLLAYVPMTAMLPIVIYVGFDITVFAFSSDDHEENPRIPRRHLIAVALGIVPALANLTVQGISTSLSVMSGLLPTFCNVTASPAPLNVTLLLEDASCTANASSVSTLLNATAFAFESACMHAADLTPALLANFASQSFFLSGAFALTQGFLLVCMLWAAIVVCWVDRLYLRATIYLVILVVLSWVGLIHAYQISSNSVANLFVGENGNWIAAPGFVFAYSVMAVIALLAWVVRYFLLTPAKAAAVEDDPAEPLLHAADA